MKILTYTPLKRLNINHLAFTDRKLMLVHYLILNIINISSQGKNAKLRQG